MDSTPHFSWKLSSNMRGCRQSAYRILISGCKENFENGIYDAWDSGKVLSSDSINIPYNGKKLVPRCRYLWKVVVYDIENIPYESEPAFFETGKLNEKWNANWITASYINNEASSYTAPYIRTSFEICNEPIEARLYICGLGYFYVYINGEKPSEDMLAPAFTKYDSTALYLTYDVSHMIKAGKNAIGVILGNGWYNSFAEDPWNGRQATWRHWPKLIAELHIKFSDGSETVIATNRSWKSSKSPIVFNGIRNGEFYDARLEISNWNMQEFDDSKWENAKIIRPSSGALRSFEIQPIRITKEFHPIRKWLSPNGSWIFDLGQNFAGAARINVKGKTGTEIVLKYSDLLKNDNLSLDQAPIAGFVKSGEFQTDKYIKKSDEMETWHPIFVYHGFQYVEISGLDYEPDIDTVVGLAMHTDFEKRGWFNCSSEVLNNIQGLCYWSTVSNFYGIPTDCPHREKNAWTGDASVSAEQTLINFASAAAYTKWMRDIKDSQKPNGTIPCIVPSTGWGYNWGNGPDWSSALTLIPWYIYLYCGDKAILEEMYDAIKKHCNFIESMADNYIVNYGIGDWCPPFDGPAISANMGSFKTPTSLTDTAYFYNTADTISKIAKILCREPDAKYYKELANRIKTAFRNMFFNKEEMRIAGDCQTSTACMLYQGLFEEDEKEGLIKLLLKQIEEKDCHIDFGMLGNKYVMQTLGDEGYVNTGVKMISQETYPSFKVWIDRGATTLWECWNGLGSHNHHMFSDVSAFMYKYIGGINPDENEPGFKHIILKPALGSVLSYVECKHESMYGLIECSWHKNDEKIILDVQIPMGSYATLYLPSFYEDKTYECIYECITEFANDDINGTNNVSGMSGTEKCCGIDKSIKKSIDKSIDGKNMILDLDSGKYRFEILYKASN